MDHTMPEGAVWRGVTGGLRTIYIQVKNHAPEAGVLGGESQVVCRIVAPRTVKEVGNRRGLSCQPCEM
ncbi:hypothetical protein NBRC116593_44080 [Sulfitobacter pacificus]